MERQLSEVEGVASGRAQIKWEARGASVLRGPLAPAHGGAISLLSLSTTRLQLAAAELGREGVVKRRQSRSGIWARQSREVCALRAGGEAAPGAAGGPRR